MTLKWCNDCKTLKSQFNQHCHCYCFIRRSSDFFPLKSSGISKLSNFLHCNFPWFFENLLIFFSLSVTTFNFISHCDTQVMQQLQNPKIIMCLPTFRRVVFAWHFCVQKLCKINKKKFLCILRVYLLSPISFISIFILETSNKIFKNSLFWGPLEWYDPFINSLRGHSTISLLKNRFFFVAFFDRFRRIYLIKQKEYYMEQRSVIKYK